MTGLFARSRAARLLAGDKGQAAEALKAAVPVIDAMARKGIIHKNKAARHKSRLTAHIKALKAA